jgi:hypothetical protein
MTLTVEAILAVVFVVVLMNLFKRHSQPPASSSPQPDLANLRPTDARAGDVISVAGAGDNMSDLDFTADRYTFLRAGARTWFEVGGMYRERRIAMRVENTEDVEVWLLNDPRKLTIQDLGLSEEDLAEMDERQNPADSFGFDNTDWLWRQSAEATASRNDQSGAYQSGAYAQPQGFYYWEFREQGGKGLLAVRKPQGEPFTVSLYRQIPAADVTIYRNS